MSGVFASRLPQGPFAEENHSILLFLLFFLLFPFFLGSKLGLFLLFPLAFVFTSLVTHICFSFPADLGHAEYIPPSTPIDAETRVNVLVGAPTPIQ